MHRGTDDCQLYCGLLRCDGDECAFECNAGFRSNSTRHVCGPDGLFGGGSCSEIVNCGNFPVENAVIDGETFYEGTGITVVCVDGFELEVGGAVALECSATGEWWFSGGLLRPVCTFVPPPVQAALSLDGVDSAVLEEGSSEREAFEASFMADIASVLGVTADDITVREIYGGRRRAQADSAVSVNVDFEIASADSSGALAATSSLNELAAAIEDGSAGAIGGATPGAMTVEFDELFINCPLQYIRCKGVLECAASLTRLQASENSPVYTSFDLVAVDETLLSLLICARGCESLNDADIMPAAELFPFIGSAAPNTTNLGALCPVEANCTNLADSIEVECDESYCAPSCVESIAALNDNECTFGDVRWDLAADEIRSHCLEYGNLRVRGGFATTTCGFATSCRRYPHALLTNAVIAYRLTQQRSTIVLKFRTRRAE